jgi:DNA primase
MEFQDFLNLLENVRPSGQGYQARCPAHDDRNPSLSVTEGDDGQILVHCHTGCTSDDVVKAMGRKMSDLYNQSETFGRSRVSKRSEYKRESSPDPIPEDMVEKLHNALTPDDRASLSSERMLSDAVIDRYQLGIVEENDKRRISIPILDE